jgi:hypothetical protein
MTAVVTQAQITRHCERSEAIQASVQVKPRIEVPLNQPLLTNTRAYLQRDRSVTLNIAWIASLRSH